MAGGSQIIIDKNGITLITPGKMESKAGQHIFKGGENITTSAHFLPSIFNIFEKTCAIKKVYKDTIIPFENISNTLVAQKSPIQCSSYLPKKHSKNYSLKFPVINSYPVDLNGNKTGQPLIKWETIPPLNFDLLYDPSLNKIIAKVIIKVDFLDAIELINGVETSVPYNSSAMSSKQQKAVPRTYDGNKLKPIKTKIEETLNKEVKYLTPKKCNKATGCTCKIPISLEVEFVKDGRYHNKINLFPKSERSNTLNWGEDRVNPHTKKVIPPNKTHTFAHEVGHYFAFVDEYYYFGGMNHKNYINPITQIVDLNLPEPQDNWKRNSSDNLMGEGALKENPKVPKYYVNFVKEWFENETKIQWDIIT